MNDRLCARPKLYADIRRSAGARIIVTTCRGGGIYATIASYELFAPPSSIMHKKSIIAEVGTRKDSSTLRLPTDMEFLTRLRDHGELTVPANRLTVFKFPSTQRPNSYIEKPSYQQAEYVERIRSEADFLHLGMSGEHQLTFRYVLGTRV